MARYLALLIVGLVMHTVASASVAVPTEVPEEKFGYISPRPKAHLFYWFMRSYVSDAAHAPLVLWLQGGPGGSSTGFGNYLEIGPEDISGTKRQTTWLRNVNLLFVDQPVGTGYSYVDDDSGYTRTEEDIANDMIALLKGITEEVPSVQKMPFYIFSESYGGKMASTIGNAVYKTVQSGKLALLFQGVALGDSWVDPVTIVKSYGSFLLNLGQVDVAQAAILDQYGNKMDHLVNTNQTVEATQQWSAQQTAMEKFTGDVNVYNFLQHNVDENEAVVNSDPHPLFRGKKLREDSLTDLMNGPVKKRLGIPDKVVWGGSAGAVFHYLAGDFMQSVAPVVSELLHNGVNVNVYNGELDVIVTTPAVNQWLSGLEWDGISQWKHAEKEIITLPSGDENGAKNTTVAYVKAFKNLHCYHILNAGHMVPADQPLTAFEMMRRITKTSPLPQA